MFHTLSRKLDVHHAAMQGTYFFAFCALWGYGPVLLLNRGLSNSILGIITASALIASIFVQPFLSSLADRNSRFSDRRLALALSLFALVLAVTMLLGQRHTVLIAAGYAPCGVLLVTLSPFFNSMVMAYYLRGVPVNYGFGRGFGSAAYAAMALVLGLVLEKHDPVLILPVFVAGLIGQAVSIWSFRYPLPDDAVAPAAELTPQVLSIRRLLHTYPAFALLLIGGALLMGAHNTINTYMIRIVEKVGAGESLMGVVLAIAAFVELPAMTLFPRFHRRFSLRTLFCFCAGTAVIRAILLLTATAPWSLYVAAVLQFCESGLFFPCTVYYVAEKLDRANQTKGQGLIHVLSNGAGPALLTLLGGVLADRCGINGALWLILCATLVGFAVICLATSRHFDKESGTT